MGWTDNPKEENPKQQETSSGGWVSKPSKDVQDYLDRHRPIDEAVLEVEKLFLPKKDTDQPPGFALSFWP